MLGLGSWMIAVGGRMSRTVGVKVDPTRQYEALDLLRWSYYLVWWSVLLLLCLSVVIRPGVLAGAAGLVGDLGDAVGAALPSLVGFWAFQVPTVGIL